MVGHELAQHHHHDDARRHVVEDGREEECHERDAPEQGAFARGAQPGAHEFEASVLVDDFDNGHRSEQEDDDLARVAKMFEQDVLADELLGLGQEAAVGAKSMPWNCVT